MTDPLNPKQADRLIADYLAGSLSEADRPVFEDWLRASPKHPQLVARLSMTDFCIRELCQDTKSDYLLDILNQIDQASGPAQLVTLHHLESPWQRYRIHAAWGAIAAALLLAAALWAILLTGPQPQTLTHNTPTQNKPAESAQPILRDRSTTPVATLTNTHNAQWSNTQAERASARGSLITGSKLHPGTRLTLTHGFAEITTNRGAIAILQAPATLELINHNAIRLHTGKLVGICETESSKGFLVRTPHMDITDLGTRFGVDATDEQATEVHVYEGAVEVAQQYAGATPQRLSRGQAVRVSGDSTGLVAIDLDTRLLEASLSRPTMLTMTGTGLMFEQADPNWRVVAVDGEPIASGGEMRAHQDTQPGGEGDTEPMFLKISEALYPAGKGSAVFTCRSTFVVPDDTDPAEDRLVVWVEADHSVKAVRIDGQSLDVPANRTELIQIPINLALTAAAHTIEVDVLEAKYRDKPFRAGLRARIELQRAVPNNEPTPNP